SGVADDAYLDRQVAELLIEIVEHDQRSAGSRDVLAEFQLGSRVRLVAREVHCPGTDAELAHVVLHADSAVARAGSRRSETEKREDEEAAKHPHPRREQTARDHSAVKAGIAGPLTSLTNRL